MYLLQGIVAMTWWDPTVNGMSRVRSEDSDSISLDLGVGMSGSVAENRSNERHQQVMDTEVLQNQANSVGSNFKVLQVNPIPTYYGVVNGGGVYGSRDNRVESSLNFQTQPLNHSSNPYPQNLERILLGP
ncbi:putative WRKY transcription factor 20 [Camellia lanceoleosa]|uniref:WRKY transcription factor 20 n=1 Tax=Camellia lanceoleosa TaxID=1840588 RepID=A0ACC0H825_9ERIC|nr:putative WRKY transcription factor 20 [Camellia lanceoleosa]